MFLRDMGHTQSVQSMQRRMHFGCSWRNRRFRFNVRGMERDQLLHRLVLIWGKAWAVCLAGASHKLRCQRCRKSTDAEVAVARNSHRNPTSNITHSDEHRDSWPLSYDLSIFFITAIMSSSQQVPARKQQGMCSSHGDDPPALLLSPSFACISFSHP
jgi:hypothetical protein